MGNFMELKEFVAKYNGNVPNIDFFLKKMSIRNEVIEKKDAHNYRQRCFIKADFNIKTTNETIIEKIVYHTNIWSVGVANINIYSEFEEEKKIAYFADFNEYEFRFGIKKGNVYVNRENRIYCLFSEGYFVEFLLFYQELNFDFFTKGIKTLSSLNRDKMNFFKKLDASGLIIDTIFRSIQIV